MKAMIVCVCNKVSDRDIVAAIEAGADSVEDIQIQLGVATCCGQCLDYAESLVADVKQGLFYNAA